MTRHRDKLEVFIDKSALPQCGDVAMNVKRRGMNDLEQAEDQRSNDDIIAAVGKSMERTTTPRNALDVLGMAAPPPSKLLNKLMSGILSKRRPEAHRTDQTAPPAQRIFPVSASLPTSVSVSNDAAPNVSADLPHQQGP